MKALLEEVRGKRVGLITNQTGVDADLASTVDALHADEDTTLVCLFAPEHGLRGALQNGARVEDLTDPITGLPSYTLYRRRSAPTAEQLRDLDALVFDIQDVGARFYTYVWTMTYAMEAAAAEKKAFVVFDRPNPIGCDKVEGPPLQSDSGLIGRVWKGQPLGVPTRHGMTVGEIAQLVNEEWMDPKVELTVVPVPGYRRDTPFEKTGYPWVMPSPNMPTLDTALVYPGTCIFEATNISEGRGTTRPFEIVGAPFFDGVELAKTLNAVGLEGVRFRASFFRPAFGKHEGKNCEGVQLHITDRDAFEPVRAGLHVLKAMIEQAPEKITFRSHLSSLSGVPNLEERIRKEPVDTIIKGWQEDLDAFLRLRAKHLIYD